jgi:Protein of unknown function (DUF1566)
MPLRIAFALLLALVACGDDAPERPQVIVNVSAEPAVAQRLMWVEARLFADGGDAGEPEIRQRFALSAGGMANDKLVTLPFSFTISQREADSFELAIVGFDSFAAGTLPFVERRAVVVFDDEQTTSVSFHLGEPSSPPTPLADGSIDSSVLDASVAADVAEAAVDAGLPELPPEVLPACPQANVCTMPAYPCVPSDDGTSYSCRGQISAWPMPDYSEGAKQAPKYTVNADQGTVLDEVTGLLWQRGLPALYAGCTGSQFSAVGDSCTHAEAEHYCSQLRLADVRWRLPSKIELESTLGLKLNGIVDEEVFGDTPIEFYWSSSPVVLPVCTDCSYAVGVVGGTPFTNDLTFPVRCVHSARNPSAPPDARFEPADSSLGTLDRYTGLTWLRGTTKDPVLTLEAATEFCAGLGYRVPTLKEFFTLADVTRDDGAFQWGTGIGGLDPLWTTSVPVPGPQPILYNPGIASALLFMPEKYPPKATCVR